MDDKYIYYSYTNTHKPIKEKRFVYDGVIGPDKEDTGLWTEDLLSKNISPKTKLPSQKLKTTNKN